MAGSSAIWRRKPAIESRDLTDLRSRWVQGELDRNHHPVARETSRFFVQRNSRLLDYIAQELGIGPPARNPEPRVVDFPETFSFIEDPDSAIETMKRFVRCARDGARFLDVQQSRCTNIDLCAASVINALALDARFRLQTRFRGQVPASEEAAEIVYATGLPKVLEVYDGEFEQFDAFPLISGGSNRRSLLGSSQKELVTSDLARYIERWFKTHGHQFSPTGMLRIGKLVGEVLANAEEHSGLGTWWAAGYLRMNQGHVGDCHLTFFNFGDTLSESLNKKLLATSPLRIEIERLVEKHKRRHYFDTVKWTEEELWTLYAIQDGVTCQFDVDRTRGLGTADMIEEFQELGGTIDGHQPKMCVVSGRSCLLFDAGRYRLKETRNGDRREIAFNEENDLEQRPDDRWVRRLRHRFPGTLISLRFYLDRDYLQAIATPRTV